MNRTELRHRMLTAVSRASVAVFHGCLEWGDQDKHMLRTDARSLSSLIAAGLAEIETPQGTYWGSMSLTQAGRRSLAEWDEKYGPVTP